MIELQQIRAALAREEPRLLPEPTEVRARACVAAVLAGPPGDLSLCFIQRAAHPDDPWSGQMGLPGGRAEEGDPSPPDVAIRETREELGLDLERAEYIGRLSELPIRPVIHAGGVLSPFVFYAGEELLRLVPNYEVAAAHWVRLAHLWAPENADTLAREYGGVLLYFPGIRYGEQIIWGLTYGILGVFAAAIGRPLPQP